METMTKGSISIMIPELLEARGITISEFARMTGLAYGTASGLARGYVDRVDLRTLAAVCGALGVTPGDIFRYTPDTESNK